MSGLGYLVDVPLAFVENRGGEAEERRVYFEGLKARGKRRLADRQTSETMAYITRADSVLFRPRLSCEKERAKRGS